jgi:DnaJ-domain-containing protein 1
MTRSRDFFVEEEARRRPAQRARACDHPSCPHHGEFRAPRSREPLEARPQYYWFCLDHVREYNAAWNYYAGMSEAEIEAELRRDIGGQRPTWPMGWRVAMAQWRDPFGVFAEGFDARAEPERRPMTPEEQAQAVFELPHGFTQADLKRRYKILVKTHHPDANGGDKSAEERLKIITQAYALLKARFAPRTEN